MHLVDKLSMIRQALKSRGEPGTVSQLGRLLSVNCSTVYRWLIEKTTPNRKQTQRLDILFRVAVKANTEHLAAESLFKVLLTPAGPGLLAMGYRGVLVAASFGWVVGIET